MRRVLACIGIAAAACLTALPAATADPTTEVDAAQQRGVAKISEVAPSTPLGLDQFLEIGNQSRTAELDLSGYTFQIYQANGRPLGRPIPIAEGAVLQPLTVAAPQDAFWTIGLGSGVTGFFPDQEIVLDIPVAGGVALFNPFGVQVDAVAFSSVVASVVREGAPAPQMPLNMEQLEFEPSIARDVFLKDTNINQRDFSLHIRTPEAPN
jgi:hypothetical protein